MSVLHSLLPRSYLHEEPEPCPDHGRLSLTGRGVWYCGWTRTELRESSTGMYQHKVRCTYRPGRSESEVEPWDIDDGASDWRSGSWESE